MHNIIHAIFNGIEVILDKLVQGIDALFVSISAIIDMMRRDRGAQAVALILVLLPLVYSLQFKMGDPLNHRLKAYNKYGVLMLSLTDIVDCKTEEPVSFPAGLGARMLLSCVSDRYKGYCAAAYNNKNK